MKDVVVPLPIQIVIDDVGWWTPTDGSAKDEPFRSGMPRAHVPADYAAIARLGNRLGMRPQAAMMLCDWDRDLLLRELPEATWMGRDWNHPWCEHPHLDEAAQILNDEADHLEIVVHGLAHEWWGGPTMERAEWANPEGVMRPRHLLERHLEVYAAILRRNGLAGEHEGLPPFFVPCAFRHSFGEGSDGIAGLLAQVGISYVSTPFSSMRQLATPQTDRIAIECGVMTVDRGGGSPSWKHVAASPPEAVDGPIIGLHWPNLLHQDPSRNDEVIDDWVAALTGAGHTQRVVTTGACGVHSDRAGWERHWLRFYGAGCTTLHCCLGRVRRQNDAAESSSFCSRGSCPRLDLESGRASLADATGQMSGPPC
ncbi:MAG: hypothetical protein QGG05_06715 [Candidatus Latescibacteria bacterium]|nr:hypothetical protein [Candidatus Latescibacterota bacterium]